MRARLDPSAPAPRAGSIQVEVLVFGQLVELLGRRTMSVRLPRPATARDVFDAVLATLPDPAPCVPPLAFAINRAHATPESTVEDGDEVALLPPLAGV
jgi:molybdopterin converting factor small subunit